MMKAICSECKNEYQENDTEMEIFIESDCPMLCQECCLKLDKELESRLNL
jgi:hypothetical protein